MSYDNPEKGEGFYGELWEDDDMFFEVEDDPDSLQIHVGPVYKNDQEGEEKGIWITMFERNYERTKMVDTQFLLSKSTFDKMVEHVNKRFE